MLELFLRRRTAYLVFRQFLTYAAKAENPLAERR